ncbi:MAG TPA: GDSL-type esterase/lipase family protein, partial [Planctomycetota bacterium]|nr:GDSL-type esterase/lipase family protein [Planctomycetota bacterium]
MASERQRRLRRRLTLAAPLVGLLAAEAVVREAGWAPLPIPRQEGPNFRDSDCPVERYVNVPGAELSIPFVDALGRPPRVVRATINADGFRGPRVPRERTPGVARIACVGDRHTFGWGVDDGETWPAVLARELEGVEVINAGVNGYDAEQESAFCRREVLAWQPDLVLWQFFLNDAGMREMPLQPGQELGGLLALARPGRGGAVGTLRARWRTLDLVLDRLWKRGALRLYGDARAVYYREDAEGWQRFRAAVLAARDACVERDMGFAMLLVPFLDGRRGALAGGEAHAFVARFCAEQDIPVLDARPLLA